MSINTKVETITPKMAQSYLERNTINRKIRERTVDTYASEMASGRWVLSHQGIAFDTEGALVDGQHRLHAILRSNAAVPMMVTRGIDSKPANGVGMFTMDTVDRGTPRTIGDQLQLRHGMKNANVLAAATAAIGVICTSGHSVSMTVPRCLAVLKLYGSEIMHCAENHTNIQGLRSSPILASVAFAMKVAPELAMEFWEKLMTGENIKKGDPAFACRNAMLAYTTKIGGATDRSYRTNVTLSCLKFAAEGNSLTKVHNTVSGRDYWVARQKSRALQVRALFTFSVDVAS